MATSKLSQLLGLEKSPVAISFVDQAPQGVARASSPEPASCGYWRRAAEGEVFYTVAEDHKNCPIGAHTHNVPLSQEEQRQAASLVETMVGLSYLKMEEVARIPARNAPLRVAVYAPQGRDRLSDYARAPEAFRYVVTQKNTLIINAAHIVELTELAD